MKKVLHSFVLLGIFAVPLVASASVLITEFMYDLEGPDSGYEWVELTNTGAAPVDIGDWRFVESGTNHKLTLVVGDSSILQPGQSAILADKPENFLARHPTVSPVFDSAFALSNEGETLMLKNAAGEVEDQLTYRSSLGAAGDGASLHLEGEILRPAMPNPGVYPGELVPVQKQEESAAKDTSVGVTSPDGVYVAVGAAPASKSSSLLPWLVGLMSIIGLGVAGAFLVKAEQPQPETKSLVDEFEIE